MHSDRLEAQAETRLMQLRQKRQHKQSKAESKSSRHKASVAPEYRSNPITASFVLMPGMSFTGSQPGGNIYAPIQMPGAPVGTMPARNQAIITPDALPAIT